MERGANNKMDETFAKLKITFADLRKTHLPVTSVIRKIPFKCYYTVISITEAQINFGATKSVSSQGHWFKKLEF